MLSDSLIPQTTYCTCRYANSLLVVLNYTPQFHWELLYFHDCSFNVVVFQPLQYNVFVHVVYMYALVWH